MNTRTLASVILLVITRCASGAETPSIESIAEQVVSAHMSGKQIPGMSVAVVHNGEQLFAGGYGMASIELGVAATAHTVYPISSVSKMFAGLLAQRLVAEGRLDLGDSIAEFLEDIPADKRPITVRHLLQHTHGLEDFYRSETYIEDTGLTVEQSSLSQLLSWSLKRPARFQPGDGWQYSLTGYILLGMVLESAGGARYAELVERHVLQPLEIKAAFGGSTVPLPGRNPLLYERVDGEIAGRIVDFPEHVWPAGGLNMSVTEMAKLFVALSDDEFLDHDTKQRLWKMTVLPNGDDTHYALGWTSYVTSQDRWAVGHEGGGASWVLYYPDIDLAVIALSNLSGARADSLPYEIARALIAAGLLAE